MTKVKGYELNPGETTHIAWTRVDKCPVVGDYIIRTMVRHEVRDAEGKLVVDFLRR